MAVLNAILLRGPGETLPAQQPGLAESLSAARDEFFDPTVALTIGKRLHGTLTHVQATPGNVRQISGSIISAFGADQFQGVLFEPAILELGVLGRAATFQIKLRNAHLVPVTLSSISANGNTGLQLGFAEGFTLARTQERIVTLTATMDGPETIAASYVLTFTGEGVSFDLQLSVTGTRTDVLLAGGGSSGSTSASGKRGVTSINWGERVVVTYAYRTDLFTSRSGREQRRALRHNPRIAMEFTLDARHGDGAVMEAYLAAKQSQSVTMVDPTDGVNLSSSAAMGSDQLPLTLVPTWAAEGVVIAIPADDETALYTIKVVGAGFVQVVPTLQDNYQAGLPVNRAHRGYMAPTLNARQPASSYLAIAMRFEAIPPGGDRAQPPAAAVVHNNLEVWLKRPNWGGNPQLTYDFPVERVDYERGLFEVVNVIQFPTRTTTWAYTCRDRAAAWEMRNFFDRAYGMRGEFYAPTWKQDLVPTGQLQINTSFFVARGEHAARDLSGSTVYRRIVIMLRDGTNLIRLVNSLALDGSGNTTVSLDSAFPSTIDPEDIIMVSWLHRCRLASDILTLTWLTDSVCTTTLPLRTLEDVD